MRWEKNQRYYWFGMRDGQEGWLNVNEGHEEDVWEAVVIVVVLLWYC